MLGADQRGQAIQIGAIILFSFAVIAFSLYQATVVPDQNAQVEFNHNQEVQQDMLELRGSVLSAGTSGSGTATTVRLGAQYPARIIAVNPGAPSGSLRTVDPGGRSTVTITNATATGEVGDYWNGTNRTYTTRGLVYQPNYNEYRRAPETVYENTVVYNRGPNDGVSLQTGQRLVSGREVDLTVLLGSYQADQSGSVSVDVRSPTNPSRTITVESADPIRLILPTDLSQAAWNDLLEQETGTEGHVSDVSVSDGNVTIELEPNTVYELRVPATGIGTDVTDPEPVYITDVSGDGTSVPEGGTQQVVAEVRNEFNGPESGVSTTATTDDTFGSDSVSCVTSTTDQEGQVSCTYTAPTNVNSRTSVDVTIQFDDGSPETEVATFQIDVLNSDGTGGPNDGDTGAGTGFSSLSASDLDNTSDSDTQQFKFTPESDIPGGTSVTIDLTNTGNGESKIDYSNAIATADVGNADNPDGSTINYQAPSEGISAGTEVVIEVSDIDPGKNSDGTYTVTFTRGDTGESATAEFTVT